MAGGPLWTTEEDALIRAEYPAGDLRVLAVRLGRRRDSLRNRAMRLGVRRLPSRARETKVCTKCRIAKAPSEFRARVSSAGVKYCEPSCRACERAAARADAEGHNAATRRWRARHPEQARKLGREANLRRADKRRIEWKRWYAEHRAEVIAKASAYAQKNAERIKARKRAQYAIDPFPVYRQVERRRARLAQVLCTLTKAQWEAVLDLYGHRCAYCGRADVKLTKDHILPISRGGPHTRENVVPACKPCNSRKQARTPEEWGHPISDTMH